MFQSVYSVKGRVAEGQHEPRQHIGFFWRHFVELRHDLLHLISVGDCHLLLEQHFGIDESVACQMAQGYHLVGPQPLEYATAVGYIVVWGDLAGDVLLARVLQLLLIALQADLVGQIWKQQIEVVDAQAVYLHRLVAIKTLQDVKHAINGVKGVECGYVHCCMR